MKSLKELYRVGKGPSSSHTMGPQRAAKLFLERCANVRPTKLHCMVPWLLPARVT